MEFKPKEYYFRLLHKVGTVQECIYSIGNIMYDSSLCTRFPQVLRFPLWFAGVPYMYVQFHHRLLTGLGFSDNYRNILSKRMSLQNSDHHFSNCE